MIPACLKSFTKCNVFVICGHYGVGKTNLCLNLAYELSCLAKKDTSFSLKDCSKVTIVDLDLVNPYFRSSEYHVFCKKNNIELVTPVLANSTLDIPSISGRIESLVGEHLESNNNNFLIIDLGGDDQGSKIAGRFAKLLSSDNSQVAYVLNFKRNLTSEIVSAYEIMQEIQSISSLKIDSIINNTHLGIFTDVATVELGLKKAKSFSMKYFLNLVFTTAPKELLSILQKKYKDEKFFAIKRIVKTPWDKWE